jgi:flavorubredoxin
MTTAVTEIAPDVFRLSTFAPDYGIQFNQFLLRDDEPFLMHTGFKRMFPGIRDAIATVLDPRRLRWIGFSHFESDECGALNDWLAVAPQAQAVSSVVGTTVNLADFAERPARPLADGEVIATGRYRLRFLATPHLPHGWDAGLFFEERQRTLLCSDLFFQPGEPAPLTTADIVGPAREAILGGRSSPLANDLPYTPYTDATFERLAALAPRTLAVMHGASFSGDCQGAIRDLATVIRETLGPAAAM